jgi:hypothetical protein
MTANPPSGGKQVRWVGKAAAPPSRRLCHRGPPASRHAARPIAAPVPVHLPATCSPPLFTPSFFLLHQSPAHHTSFAPDTPATMPSRFFHRDYQVTMFRRLRQRGEPFRSPGRPMPVYASASRHGAAPGSSAPARALQHCTNVVQDARVLPRFPTKLLLPSPRMIPPAPPEARSLMIEADAAR